MLSGREEGTCPVSSCIMNSAFNLYGRCGNSGVCVSDYLFLETDSFPCSQSEAESHVASDKKMSRVLFSTELNFQVL